MKNTKITIELECGCVINHELFAGEIELFQTRAMRMNFASVVNDWVEEKITKHRCEATSEDVARYLSQAIKMRFFNAQSEIEDFVSRLADREGKKILFEDIL